MCAVERGKLDAYATFSIFCKLSLYLNRSVSDNISRCYVECVYSEFSKETIMYHVVLIYEVAKHELFVCSGEEEPVDKEK